MGWRKACRGIGQRGEVEGLRARKWNTRQHNEEKENENENSAVRVTYWSNSPEILDTERTAAATIHLGNGRLGCCVHGGDRAEIEWFKCKEGGRTCRGGACGRFGHGRAGEVHQHPSSEMESTMLVEWSGLTRKRREHRYRLG